MDIIIFYLKIKIIFV